MFPKKWLTFITSQFFMVLLVGTVMSCQKMNFSRIVKVKTGQVSVEGVSEALVRGSFRDAGEKFIYEHGHCWAVEVVPDIGDSRTKLGESNGVGDFISTLTGLESGTDYYVRSYATTEDGTSYGDMKSFRTFGAIDFEGNLYRSVSIGDQEWLAENLRSAKYSDGTPLVDGTSVGDISGNFVTRYFFNYGDDPDNSKVYGLLYTHSAAVHSLGSSSGNPSGIQGVCPSGWHIPSDSEWKQLETFIGMSASEVGNLHGRGTDQGNKLKNPESFQDESDNSSGFNALASGWRQSDGSFEYIENGTWYWTCTEVESWAAYARSLFTGESTIDRWTWSEEIGMSVRCVKDLKGI